MQQKPELCIIRGMKINKTQFGLPIADTSTPINERVLSLARLIEQHGYTPQHEVPWVLFLGLCLDFHYSLTGVVFPKFGFDFSRRAVA